MRIEYYCISSPASIPIVLQRTVSLGFVQGVIAPITPNGPISIRVSPLSPDHAVVVMSSGTRSLICYQVMFEDLISYITHTSFLNTHTCQYFRILFDLLADAGDDLLSLVHRHCLNYLLSLFGRLDSIIHILENAMFSGRSICNLHLCHNFLYNFLYHILTYWHEIVLLNIPSKNYFRPS